MSGGWVYIMTNKRDGTLYVGVTAHDNAPELIRDPVVRTDQVRRTQDFVVVYIDAIGSELALATAAAACEGLAWANSARSRLSASTHTDLRLRCL